MKDRKPARLRRAWSMCELKLMSLMKNLIDLIAERFGYVDRAWQLKKNPEDATVPWRINEVIDKVRARAEDQRYPPTATPKPCGVR